MGIHRHLLSLALCCITQTTKVCLFSLFLVEMMGQVITVTKLNCTSYEPRWTIRKNSLKTFCSNTGLIRDDPYWNSRKNSLELIELSSINKVSSV